MQHATNGRPPRTACGKETAQFHSVVRDGPCGQCAPPTDSACESLGVGRGVGRGLTRDVQDNETVKVISPHDDPVTHGNLRIKGRFGYQHVQNRG